MYVSKDGKIQDQEHLVASFIISLFFLPVNHLKLERNLAHLEFDGTPLWIFLSKNVRLALKIRKSIDNKIKLAIIISVVVRSLERSRICLPVLTRVVRRSSASDISDVRIAERSLYSLFSQKKFLHVHVEETNLTQSH